MTQHPEISNQHWINFRKSSEKIKSQFPKAINFTIIDYLLNCFKIKTFQLIMKTLEQNIGYTYRPNTTHFTQENITPYEKRSERSIYKPINNQTRKGRTRISISTEKETFAS